VDARSPVSFFAYPGRPSDLVPEGCVVHPVAGEDDDVSAAVNALAAMVAAEPGSARHQQPDRPGPPSGPLTAQGVCQALGALLPEGAIVSDEGNTSGLFAPGATAGAPPHDWLCLSGGAIGQGLPLALGAAMAEPDRRVIALEADGSALYTFQAWWTMARQGLDVTTILLNNHSYAVLNMELDRVGVGAPGPKARDMLDLGHPSIDFTGLATGLGLVASRAETAEDFTAQLARALATPGPSLVEAVVPPLL
jgi:acetolactate synthase-1/2/3 large subunit